MIRRRRLAGRRDARRAANPIARRSLLFGAIAGRIARVLLLVGLCATGSHPTPPSLDVEVAGCEMVRDRAGHLACVVGGPSPAAAVRGPREAGEITISVRTPPGYEPVVSVDDAPVQPREQGPDWMHVPIAKGAHTLVVSAGWQPARSFFRLPLATADNSADMRSIKAAMEDRKAGRVDAAKQRIAELARSESAATRARAQALLARIVTREDLKAGLDQYEVAIRMDRDAGLISAEILDTLALAWTLVERKRDLAGATRALDDLDHHGALAFDAEGRALERHVRALIALSEGRLGDAHRFEIEAEQRAARLDLRGQLAEVYQLELEILDRLGRRDGDAREVVEKMRRTPPPADQPCALAAYEMNVGLHELRSAGPGAEHDVERRSADVHFEKAEALHAEGGGCADPCMLRNTRTTRARAALDLGKPEEAERHLKAAEKLCPDAPANHVAEWHLHAGLAAIARAPREAKAELADARDRSAAEGLPQLEVEATLGLARLAEGSGDVEGALDLYRAADDRLGRWSALVPFGLGKGAFFDHHEEGAGRYLDLLFRSVDEIAPADPRRAVRLRRLACVARNGISRALASEQWTYRVARSRDNREDLWKALDRYEAGRRALSAEVRRAAEERDEATRIQRLGDLARRGAVLATDLDAEAARIAGSRPAPACADGVSGLSEPAGDEVILVYHPLRDGAWLGIAVTRAEVIARRFQLDRGEIAKPGAREALAARLLSPFASVLDDDGGGARRLRIFAAEPLASLDLHDLAVRPRERPLADRFVVSHGVDLLRAEAAPPPAVRRALVVIPDPEGIPTSANEAASVPAALRGLGWDVRPLVGAAATREAVLGALARDGVELFHFYGHGKSEGRDAWQSRLMLHGGDFLSIGDVIALERAPRLVVLATCEGASAEAGTYVQGPALAHAFLIAGAEHVIGNLGEPSAPLMDKLVEQLYARRLPALLADPAAALRDAFRALRAEPSLARVELPRTRVLTR
jgi:tetratricopeptide (TPR) repeat protein